MSIRRRFTAALSHLNWCRYLAEQGFDRSYDVHVMRQELEFDQSRGIRTPEPTDAGLWLMAYWMDAVCYVQMAVYVLTGHYSWRFDDQDLEEAHYGRNE